MKKKEVLIATLETLRRKEHFYLEGDPWFSCPMHPNYIGSQDRNVCDCGFFIDNKRVDEALVLVEELINEYFMNTGDIRYATTF